MVTESTSTTTSTISIPEWKQNLINLAKIDINATRKEYCFPAPRFLTNLLGVEARDEPLWYCVFNCIVFILINLALLPILMKLPWYCMAFVTLARIKLIGRNFILAMHYSAHRSVIKPRWLNNFIIEYCVIPFFGLPPGLYRFHHIVMHHREDNIYPYDVSSTMPYQRDSFPFCCLHYWLRFEFAIWFELPYYLFFRKYWGMFLRCITFMTLWWIGNAYLWTTFRPALPLWLFLFPQFIASIGFMWGNFSQHIFVDPDHYTDDYRLTICILASRLNQLTFNDGYHTLHHKYPTLHWSELPKTFLTERELKRHEEHNAICMKNIAWAVMGAHVWFGWWEKLVRDHFVPTTQKQADMTMEERIEFLKYRLTAIHNQD